MTAPVAGLVVLVAGTRRFVSAAFVQRVVRRPQVTPVPGAALGIALIDGTAVPVLEVGDDSHEVLLCRAEGQLVALGGVHVLTAGSFPQRGSGIELNGQQIPTFDVEDALRQLQPGHAQTTTEDP